VFLQTCVITILGRFPSISVDFCRFASICVDLRRFASICVDLHRFCVLNCEGWPSPDVSTEGPAPAYVQSLGGGGQTRLLEMILLHQAAMLTFAPSFFSNCLVIAVLKTLVHKSTCKDW
jgi:hypothetical protein